MAGLLAALVEGGRAGRFGPGHYVLAAVSIGLLVEFARWERRAPEPLLPLRLFANRMFRAAAVSGFLAGMAMFGTISFIPLFVQGVLGGSATEAGSALTPFVLGWVTFSVVSARLLLRIGYRWPVVGGMVCLAVAFLLMSHMGLGTSRAVTARNMLLAGHGDGAHHGAAPPRGAERGAPDGPGRGDLGHDVLPVDRRRRRRGGDGRGAVGRARPTAHGGAGGAGGRRPDAARGAHRASGRPDRADAPERACRRRSSPRSARGSPTRCTACSSSAWASPRWPCSRRSWCRRGGPRTWRSPRSGRRARRPDPREGGVVGHPARAETPEGRPGDPHPRRDRRRASRGGRRVRPDRGRGGARLRGLLRARGLESRGVSLRLAHPGPDRPALSAGRPVVLLEPPAPDAAVRGGPHAGRARHALRGVRSGPVRPVPRRRPRLVRRELSRGAPRRSARAAPSSPSP